MMKQEIEIKFLVEQKHFKTVVEKHTVRRQITQGYLFGSENIRVRTTVQDNIRTSVLTIKGDREGKTRDEFEICIPYEEGVEMLSKFAPSVIFKTRYIVQNGRDVWEIDDFHGKNAGLIIAELEVPQEDYNVERPPWMDKWVAVTDDNRYYNFYLAEHPFTEWENEGRQEQTKK